MRKQTYFSKMTDSDLYTALNDYEKFNDSATIPVGSILADARDFYVDKYKEHGLMIMEIELLYEGSYRWRRLIM